MQVNENGVVSFENSFQFYRTPDPLPLSRRYIVAPYWAGIDIRRAGNIFYRQTTEPSLLARATEEIKSSFPTSSNAPIKNLFIATWDAVGYLFRKSDKVASYTICLCT